MATDQLPLGGYEHATHHHHVMPNPQNQNGVIPSTPAENHAPHPTDAADLQSPSPGVSCIVPSWTGFVHTTLDALMVLEACLQGKLRHIGRRPHDRERTQIITSGNVFIYEENASGIKRWTDGVTWSPSRIMGNFLVYRELSSPFPAGEKKKAKKRKRGSSEEQPNAQQGVYTEQDRKLVGSLVDSYGFKPNGLIKKTLNVKHGNRNHHIVSYYALEDVKTGHLTRPQFDPTISDVVVRLELMDHQFKVPIIDPEEDNVQLDPWVTNMSMRVAAQSLHRRPPPLSMYTDGPALHETNHAFPHMSGQIMNQSPQSMSSGHTPSQQFSMVFGSTDAQYLNTGIMNGLPHGLSNGDRMDSVVDGHEPHFKTEMPEVGSFPEMPEMTMFTPTGDRGLAEPPTFAQSMSHPAELFAHHNGQMNYSQLDHSEDWTAQANIYPPSVAMQQMKRQRTTDSVMQMGGGGLAFDSGPMTEYGHVQNMQHY